MLRNKWDERGGAGLEEGATTDSCVNDGRLMACQWTQAVLRNETRNLQVKGQGLESECEREIYLRDLLVGVRGP
jgi:hypothetical protein